MYLVWLGKGLCTQQAKHAIKYYSYVLMQAHQNFFFEQEDYVHAKIYQSRQSQESGILFAV